MKILVLALYVGLCYVNGAEEHQGQDFCDDFNPILSWPTKDDRFCKLFRPSDQIAALLCAKVSANDADKLLRKTECFSGFRGEQIRQDLFDIDAALKEKVDGACNEACETAKQTALVKLEGVKDIIEENDKIVKHLRIAKNIMGQLKAGMLKYRNEKNDREGIRTGYLGNIAKSGLNAEMKGKLNFAFNEAMNIQGGGGTARWDADYETIIANANREMDTMEKKRIYAENKGNVLKANYLNTKRYIGRLSNPEKLQKAGNALGHLMSAIPKLQSGETEEVISGGLDIVNGVAEFLPPPASVVTGTISGIFNSIFGVGGPSLEQKIKDQFSKQKEFLDREFNSLQAKVDRKFAAQTDEILRNRLHAAAKEMKNNQAAFDVLINEHLTFLKPIEDGNDIDSDTMIFIGTQISMFEGTVSGHRTRAFMREYCNNNQDPDLVNICFVLFYYHLETERMRDIVLTKLMLIYRRTDMHQDVVLGKLNVQKERRRVTRNFIEEVLNDKDNLQGFFIYSCIAQGKPTILADRGLPTTLRVVSADKIKAIETYRKSLKAVMSDADEVKCRGKLPFVLGGSKYVMGQMSDSRWSKWSKLNNMDVLPTSAPVHVPNLPQEVFDHSTIVMKNNLLTCGGVTDTKKNEFDSTKPDNDKCWWLMKNITKWENGPTLPKKIRFGSMVNMLDEYAMWIGGYEDNVGGSGVLSNTWKLSSLKGSWVKGPSLKHKRAWHCSGFFNGMAVSTGGFQLSGGSWARTSYGKTYWKCKNKMCKETVLSSVEGITPTGTVVQLNSMIDARYGHGCAVVKEESMEMMVVAGGYKKGAMGNEAQFLGLRDNSKGQSWKSVETVEVLRPGKKWEQVGHLPRRRSFFPMVFFQWSLRTNGTLFLFGGKMSTHGGNFRSPALASTLRSDDYGRSWQLEPKMSLPFGRMEHTAVIW